MNTRDKIQVVSIMSLFLSMCVQSMVHDMHELSLHEQEQQMARLFPQTQETELAAEALTSPSARNMLCIGQIYEGIEENNVDIVQHALKQGSAQDFARNFKDALGFTLLHEAASSANDKVIHVLIKAGVAINSKNKSGDTPLHSAAKNNSLEAAQQLIKAGAEVNVKNISHQSPLGYAVKYGSIQVIKLLLETPGITVDREELLKALAASKNNVIITPYVKQELDKILAPYLTTLVDLSVDALMQTSNKNCIKDKLRLLPQELQEKVSDYLAQKLIDNVLLQAIKTCNIPVALDALYQGAHVNVQDSEYYGNTPLHWASLINSPELMYVLLSRGADSNKKTTIGHLTPLHKAAMNGSLDALVLLLDSRAQVNAQALMGNTPLHYAALCGQVEAAQLLLDYGADSTIVNKMGHTPFDIVSLRWVNIPNRHILSQLLMPY